MVDRRRIGKNNKSRGASEERAVSAILTDYFEEPFNRVGNRGRSSADVESDTKVVEVKSRTQPTPKLIREAWEQVEVAVKETDKEGYLVVRYKDGNRRTTWLMKRIDV